MSRVRFQEHGASRGTMELIYSYFFSLLQIRRTNLWTRSTHYPWRNRRIYRCRLGRRKNIRWYHSPSWRYPRPAIMSAKSRPANSPVPSAAVHTWGRIRCNVTYAGSAAKNRNSNAHFARNVVSAKHTGCVTCVANTRRVWRDTCTSIRQKWRSTKLLAAFDARMTLNQAMTL